MPTSIPNKRQIQANGFTLVELLVVLFLVALFASAVMLLSRGSQSLATRDAERFAARVAAVRDRAVVEGRIFALWVRPSGYGFEEYINGRWLGLSEPAFAQSNWQSPNRAILSQAAPQRVAFDTAGLPSAPLTITVSDNANRTRISISATGEIDVAR